MTYIVVKKKTLNIFANGLVNKVFTSYYQLLIMEEKSIIYKNRIKH